MTTLECSLGEGETDPTGSILISYKDFTALAGTLCTGTVVGYNTGNVTGSWSGTTSANHGDELISITWNLVPPPCSESGSIDANCFTSGGNGTPYGCTG